MYKTKIILVILIFSFVFQLNSQDMTGDQSQVTDSSKLRKEHEKQVNDSINKLKLDMVNLKKQTAEIDKKVLEANNSIIKSLDNDEVANLVKTRNDYIIEKISIEQQMNDLLLNMNEYKSELSDLKKNYDSANGTVNWNYNYDISDKTKYKNGKWNITVKAMDNNKNESNEEAINIYIDPKSDIPSVNIINPSLNMRISGNLRIVGTAFDDDAIDKVVLFVDKQTDELVCNGKDFWFYDLDTSAMSDGFHSLKAKSYDINGIQSKVTGVVFQLDRKKPSIDVKTIKSGAIVSGMINIGGDASDDNGILSMEYSVNDRITFGKISSVKNLNKQKTSIEWNVKVDSNSLKQGIQTIWIKAVDKTMSYSFYPVTVTIDHSKPVISIDYPRSKTSVGGTFKVMGSINDNIGISKLYISYGSGQKSKFEEVQMSLGDPYWIFPLKTGIQKKTSYSVTAKAVDIAGNISEYTTTFNVDPDIDKPVIKLASIKKNERYTTFLDLSGNINTGNLLKDINVKVYSESSKQLVFEQKYGTNCNFSVNVDIGDIDKYPDGKYYVELQATDEYDTPSDVVKENFIIERSFPSFDEETINKWAGRTFIDKFDLPIAVIKNGGLKNVKYSIMDLKTNTPVVSDKVLKFRESKTPGRYDVDVIHEDFSKLKQPDETDKYLSIMIEAEDLINNIVKINVPVILDFTSPVIGNIVIDQKTGLKEDVTLEIKDNLKLKSVLIEMTTSGKKTTNSINLSPEELKTGYANELELIVKEQDAKSNNEYMINVSAKDLSGNETKKSFKIFFTASEIPSYKLKINVAKNENFGFLKDPSVLLSGNEIGLDSIDSTLYCLVPSTFKNFYLVYESMKKDLSPVEGDLGIYRYKFTSEEKKSVNKIKFEAGFYGITSDGLLKKIAVYNFYNDLSFPKLAILWPTGYMYFNGSINVYGAASDDSNEITASYSVDSETDFNELAFVNNTILRTETVPDLNPVKRNEKILLSKYLETNNMVIKPEEKIFKVSLPLGDMASGEHYVVIKVRDKSGKEVRRKFTVIFDNTVPELGIWNPKDDETVNGQITLSGESKDDYKLSTISVMKNGKEINANGVSFWDKEYGLNDLSGIDYKKKDINDIKIDVFAYDFAGNKATTQKSLKLDLSSDMPEIYINSPAVDGQRFTDVLEMGGVALDDDGIKYVQYRIDAVTNGKTDDAVNGVLWDKIEMEPGNPNWNKKIPTDVFTSGVHVLEVQAVDLYELKSRITKISFNIDRENPVITVNEPKNGTYVKGEVVISGKANDPNGIETVEISTNYGWTYVKALNTPSDVKGTDNWKYVLNTLSVPDGALRVLIRTKDKAGSDAFSFVLYNVDNKVPVLEIFTPKDASKVNNVFKVEGRVKDNIGIEWMKAAVILFDDKTKNLEDQFFNIKENKGAWAFDVDTRKLDLTKRYQAIIRVKDFAGNITEKSVSFYVDPDSDIPTVQLDQPQAEQHVAGRTIDFYGTAYDDDGLESVTLKIDDGEEIKVTGTTAWNYSLPAVNLKSGLHKVIITAKEVSGTNSTGKVSIPLVRTFYYDESGPVIQVLSHKNGEPIEHRPYLKGKVYFYENDLELKYKKIIQEEKFREMTVKFEKTPEKIVPIDQIPVSVSEVQSMKNKYLSENKIKSLFLSMDNGKTFEKIPVLSNNWSIRLQTQKLKDGIHVLQLKAVTISGKESINYFKVIIDTNKPVVIIDRPLENDRLNGNIDAGGIVTDNEKVEKVQISLRKNDKNFTKVPKFVQGIYLWAQFLGGPTVSGGFGFTFFEDVVRLEGLIGWTATRANFAESGQDPNNVSPFFRQTMNNTRYQPRFSGLVTGGKMLAKILDLPYGYFFGEDARNFSSSIEIGCAFYWFSGYGGAASETNNSFYLAEKGREYDAKKDGKLVAGFMYQIDLFKVERFGPFRKFAIYFENSFFFIASEMEGGLFPQFGFGIRNSLF